MLDQANTEVAVLRAEILARQTECDSAAARLRAATEEVEAREVRAPADGTIIRRSARPGDGASTLQVSTLFWFAPETPRIARIEVDEAHAARLRPGLPAEVTLEVAEAGEARWYGRVQQVSAAFAPRRVQVYQKLLDEGRYASISEMAAAEKIERGYLGTLLWLTLLTLLPPDLVEAILNGRQRVGVTLPRLLEGVPAGWGEQPNP